MDERIETDQSDFTGLFTPERFSWRFENASSSVGGQHGTRILRQILSLEIDIDVEGVSKGKI